jgi:hypothetical protein
MNRHAQPGPPEIDKFLKYIAARAGMQIFDCKSLVRTGSFLHRGAMQCAQKFAAKSFFMFLPFSAV